MGDFDGRAGSALVLGGSGALGGAIASMLAARGAAVVVTYLSNKSAADGLGHDAVQLDLTDADQCREVIAPMALHTLVYAAGPHVPMRHLSAVAPPPWLTS